MRAAEPEHSLWQKIRGATFSDLLMMQKNFTKTVYYTKNSGKIINFYQSCALATRNKA